MFEDDTTQTAKLDASQLDNKFTDAEVKEALESTSGDTIEEQVHNAKNYLYEKEANKSNNEKWESMSSVDQWKTLGDVGDDAPKESSIHQEVTGDGIESSISVAQTQPLKHADEFKKAVYMNPDLMLDPRFKEMEKLAKADWATYYSPSPKARANKYNK